MDAQQQPGAGAGGAGAGGAGAGGAQAPQDLPTMLARIQTMEFRLGRMDVMTAERPATVEIATSRINFLTAALQEKAMERGRKAMAGMPKYDGKRCSFRQFYEEWLCWSMLNDLKECTQDFAKTALIASFTGVAVDMAKPLNPTTAQFAAMTYDQFLVAIQNIFEPAAETELTREKFKSFKQKPKQDIGTYLSVKIALFERAFAENERSYTTLFDEVLNGIYSRVIKRMVRRQMPRTQQALRDACLQSVASERAAYEGGYAESADLDGLAATTKIMHDGTDAMEIDQLRDEINAIKGSCYKCGKPGHMARECRARGGNNGRGQAPRKAGDKKFNGNCRYCKKKGHKEADCYAKKNKNKGGKTDPGKGAQRQPPRRDGVRNAGEEHENEDDDDQDVIDDE